MMYKNKLMKGFTLIELILIIALIGILSAVAAHRYLNNKTDALQAENLATVAALNAAISSVYMSVQIPTAASSTSSGLSTNLTTLTVTNVPANFSGTTLNLTPIYNPSPAVNSAGGTLYTYIGLNSNGYPIGSAVTTAVPPPPTNNLTSNNITTTGGGASIAYTDIINGGTTGCANLFNALMSNNSVQASTGTTATYQAISSTPSSPDTTRPINITGFDNNFSVLGSGFTLSSANVVSSLYTGPQTCVWQLVASNVTANDISFYIFYNSTVGKAYAVSY